MNVTKASLLPFYKTLARDCRRDLKTLVPGREREIVEGNLHKADVWIKFLSDADVPEMGDPDFKQKMKKLAKKGKDATKRRTGSRRTASAR